MGATYAHTEWPVTSQQGRSGIVSEEAVSHQAAGYEVRHVTHLFLDNLMSSPKDIADSLPEDDVSHSPDVRHAIGRS